MNIIYLIFFQILRGARYPESGDAVLRFGQSCEVPSQPPK